MTINQLFQKNPRLNKAALFVLINSDNELVSFSKTNPLHNSNFASLEVVSFDTPSLSSKRFYDKYLERFEYSSYGKALIDAIERINFNSFVLFINYKKPVGCYVVVEKYFNDGTHKTEAKHVAVSPELLSDSFVSDDICDTFTKVCPSLGEVETYLHSKFYIDLVEQRKRNRDAKVPAIERKKS